MKKITFFVAAALVVCASACSTKSNEIDNLFGVKVGTPIIEVSDIMESAGFVRSGRYYDYKPQLEYYTLLGKEYNKLELDRVNVFSWEEDEAEVISISFNGHKEYDRISKYLQKYLEQTPSITTDTLHIDLLGTPSISTITKSVWVQNIENEHLVLKLEKEHEESAVYTTNERNTTTLSLERLNHM